MNLIFDKYQGTGNDFILIDNRKGVWNNMPISTIQKLCNRKFGIGADGLIKINSIQNFDFEVDYYNADGSKSFCGNGARCAVLFAQNLGIQKEEVRFLAIDGVHTARKTETLVHLEMSDVSGFEKKDHNFIIQTGSPHYISFEEEIKSIDVIQKGRTIRYSEQFSNAGINVNFIQKKEPNTFAIRTYERGVEDETLSCGTGVTAAALAYAIESKLFGIQRITAQTEGGELSISFNRVNESDFNSIVLIGPAVHVFHGEIDV